MVLWYFIFQNVFNMLVVTKGGVGWNYDHIEF